MNTNVDEKEMKDETDSDHELIDLDFLNTNIAQCNTTFERDLF
jgi:hypothetical protein